MARPKKEAPNRPDGIYEVKVTIGKTVEGKPIRKSFYSSVSKNDARAKAEQYKINVDKGDILLPGMIFEKWSYEWLKSKEGTVKEHTYVFTYQKNLEKYLIPYFRKTRLIDIKQMDIQNYFNQVRHANGNLLSFSTLDKQKAILHSMFDLAIDNDYCYKNPVKNIKFERTLPKKERNYYNEAEAEILLKYAEERNSHGIVIILQSGLRRSELLGLQWNDIDLDNKIIHVKRAVTSTVGAVIIDKTKTFSSERMIPISDRLVDYLRAMKESSESEYVIEGSEPDQPLGPHKFADRFAEFMDKFSWETKMQKLTPHELRHTYGTIQRERGVDIYTIQKVLGHSDISTTSKIYVHNDLNVLRKQLKLDTTTDSTTNTTT